MLGTRKIQIRPASREVLQFMCGILNSENHVGGSRPKMTFLNARAWETATGLALVAITAGCAFWLLRRRRPTPEEAERTRRDFLAQYGRIVDGMLLDVRELEDDNGRTITLLFYSYTTGGVEYECSQDVTVIREAAKPTQVRPGFPCSVRYQQGSPQNSIIVAEEWSGLRIDPPRPNSVADSEEPGTYRTR